MRVSSLLFVQLNAIVVSFTESTQALAATQDFLTRPSLVSVAETADPALLVRLVSEVEDALGEQLHGDTRERLGEIQDMLRPTFKALPRNSHGNIDHSAVRYALHRLFVQRHGWVIRGFQSEFFDNSSSASQLLTGRVPDLVQEIFEKRVGKHGSSFHHVAALAALLEQLITDDISVRLKGVYEANDARVENTVDLPRARSIISLYMMLSIQGYADVASVGGGDQLDLFVEHFHKLYPPWVDTQPMLDDALDAIVPDQRWLSFQDIVRVLAEAGNRFYERVHRKQCQHTKSLLMGMEDKRSGRVRLLDFYSKAINENQYQLTETAEYLRQMGMLDESDASMPRVIIPNYISGQANCVARTAYHAVCCPDECEGHLANLEQVLGRPEATPSEILAIEDGSSQQISMLLRSRLHEIAAHHAGSVPLHGRLFAQWLHFVRPTSCPYPHVSGVAYKKTMEEWEEDTGMFAGSTWEDMESFISRYGESSPGSDSSAPSGIEPSGGELGGSDEDMLEALRMARHQVDDDSAWHEVSSSMWTMDEELIVSCSQKQAFTSSRAGHQTSATHSKFSLQGVPAATAAKGIFLIAVFAVAMAFFWTGGVGKQGLSLSMMPCPCNRRPYRLPERARHFI